MPSQYELMITEIPTLAHDLRQAEFSYSIPLATVIIIDFILHPQHGIAAR